MRAVVSLGSNLGDRAGYLSKALSLLTALPETALIAASSPVETEPVGVPEKYQHLKFLNQLAFFETSLEVHEFSRLMHKIEDDLGRVRLERNGPRTIDLDLIDFGGLTLDEPDLILPHPRAAERDFVMKSYRELEAILGEEPKIF